jgi:transcriptional regulator with XRE-family HTH domain
VPISPDQCRMARAAIDVDLSEVAQITGLSTTTLYQFEQRVRRPRAATTDKLEGFLSGFVIFVDPSEEHGGGVLLRSGVSAGSWREGAPKGDLNPVDDGGTQLLEYWRARPQDWAGLPMEARASMLMAIFGRVPEVDPIASECAAE